MISSGGRRREGPRRVATESNQARLTFSALKEDRNTFPSLVIDPNHELCEGLGFARLVENGRVVEVGLLGWIGGRRDVLAEKDLIDSDRRYGFEEIDFGVSEVVAVERGGSFHREERESLEDVCFC